ncbi:MAG: cytochrome P450 [Bacteroidota bacterium]
MDEDVTVGRWTIPKGTNCSLFIHLIHRHPDIWDEPDRFDPDRWASDERARVPPYAFIPFSAGPRNCIGQRFAMQELKVVAAKFFRRFAVVSHDSDDQLRYSADLVMDLEGTLDIDIVERSD